MLLFRGVQEIIQRELHNYKTVLERDYGHCDVSHGVCDDAWNMVIDESRTILPWRVAGFFVITQIVWTAPKSNYLKPKSTALWAWNSLRSQVRLVWYYVGSSQRRSRFPADGSAWWGIVRDVSKILSLYDQYQPMKPVCIVPSISKRKGSAHARLWISHPRQLTKNEERSKRKWSRIHECTIPTS